MPAGPGAWCVGLANVPRDPGAGLGRDRTCAV